MRDRPIPHFAGPALLVLLLAVGCRPAPPPPPAAPPPPGSPRLVVLLVADQFRADYLERFAPLLDGGLARLQREGVVFTAARHRHATTATAPGHATLATGSYPSHHGIVANYWYGRGEPTVTYSAKDEEGTTSPRRLLRPTIGDWLKQRYPTARVFAASAKDRAAVLLGGRQADGAYWYDDDGSMTSSSYYPAWDAPWVGELNARRLLDRRFATPWEPLPVEEALLVRLGIRPVDLGPLHPGFPHVFGGDAMAPGASSFSGFSTFYDDLKISPWLDDYLGELAPLLVEREGLGQDAVPDLLALSFSSVDRVGHEYGPDSRELLDTVLRLDRTLGILLDRLDELVGLEHTVVAFSSDHGVAPLPELRRQEGLPGERISAVVELCLQQVGARLAQRLGPRRYLDPGPFVRPEAAREAGVEVAELQRLAAAEAERCPGVARVWTASELAGPPTGDPYFELFRNSYNGERSPDLLVQYEPYFLSATYSAADHGSPYDYDARVPFIVRLPSGRGGRSDEPVSTVDLAPTLFALLGLEPPADLDGVARLGSGN